MSASSCFLLTLNLGSMLPSMLTTSCPQRTTPLSDMRLVHTTATWELILCVTLSWLSDYSRRHILLAGALLNGGAWVHLAATPYEGRLCVTLVTWLPISPAPLVLDRPGLSASMLVIHALAHLAASL